MTQAMLRRMSNDDGNLGTSHENMERGVRYIQMNANMERCIQAPHGHRLQL